MPSTQQQKEPRPSQSQDKINVRKVLFRDMLFADDAAVATHAQEELQSLMDCLSQACKDFGRTTVCRRQTHVLGQDTEAPPAITINNYELDAGRRDWQEDWETKLI